MDPVTVGRYEPGMFAEDGTVNHGPHFTGYVGTPAWIVFVAENGELWVYQGRSETGAVTGMPVIVPPASPAE